MKRKQISKKHKRIERMFNQIAGKYDFLNHFLSAGIDHKWRNMLLHKAAPFQLDHVLDLACGTGDMTIRLARLNPKKITGVDISEKMLEIARKKVRSLQHDTEIDFVNASALSIPLKDLSVDLTTVVFGVRNFENLQQGIQEMKRVLKPDGKIAIIEFSKPKNLFIRMFYGFYLSCIVPVIGWLLTQNRAYFYLRDSVKSFLTPDQFVNILEKTGFKNINAFSMSKGIVTIYIAENHINNND